jgi:carbon monoxide dehydrogenase subunit G
LLHGPCSESEGDLGVEPAVLYRRVPVDEPDEREVRAMAAGAVDVSVAAAPDEVWKKVGDFAAVADFFPGIDSFRMEGDDRIIGMFGMEIRERLLAKDEENRVITYSVVEGVPIDSHTATISVEPAGGGSKVIWAYDVTPDEMAPIFGDTYKAALASLEGTFS